MACAKIWSRLPLSNHELAQANNDTSVGGVALPMRELTFGLAHDQGVDPVVDAFHEHGALRMRSEHCGWAAGTYWRVDRAEGPAAGLDALDERYRDGSGCHDPLVDDEAVQDRTVETLRSTANERVYYARWELDEGSHPVPGLAIAEVGPGVVFETTHEDGEQWWRLLLRSDRGVGRFYDSLQVALPESVRYVVGHLADADWDRSRREAPLTAKQAQAVETASKMGYYERPRGATQADLAAELGLPESTVSYRLRRAEAALVDAYTE